MSAEYSRVKEGDPRCLRYWYKFQGEDVGFLTVSTKPASSANPEDPVLLELRAEANPFWNLQTVPIPEDLLSWIFIFKGETEVEMPHGGMAIDDISVVHSECRPIGEGQSQFLIQLYSRTFCE